MFENQEMWSEWKALGKKLMSQPEVVFANEIRVINNWYILVCKIILRFMLHGNKISKIIILFWKKNRTKLIQ